MPAGSSVHFKYHAGFWREMWRSWRLRIVSTRLQPVFEFFVYRGMSMERKDKLCRLLKIKDGVGIELGPLSRPLITKDEGDIRYVDAMSTEELRESFKGNIFYETKDFVDIDYIWTGEGMGKIVGDTRFDYAVASHVIEHVPNVIGWLNDIFSVLKSDGKIALAIPDKRFTFDAARAPSTFALMIDNWIRGERRPALQNVFDHFSQAVKVGHDEVVALAEGRVTARDLERHHTDQEALELAKESHFGEVYRDCHVYTYTPRSLLESLRKMISMDLLPARVVDFYDTPQISQEFILVLEKMELTAENKLSAFAQIDGFLAVVRDRVVEIETRDAEIAALKEQLAAEKQLNQRLSASLNSRKAVAKRIIDLSKQAWFGFPAKPLN